MSCWSGVAIAMPIEIPPPRASHAGGRRVTPLAGLPPAGAGRSSARPSDRDGLGDCRFCAPAGRVPPPPLRARPVRAARQSRGRRARPGSSRARRSPRARGPQRPAPPPACATSPRFPRAGRRSRRRERGADPPTASGVFVRARSPPARAPARVASPPTADAGPRYGRRPTPRRRSRNPSASATHRANPGR